MTYGKTPFQSITSQIAKLHAIIDPSHRIEFPDISEKDLLDVLKVRNLDRTVAVMWKQKDSFMWLAAGTHWHLNTLRALQGI